MDSNDLLVRQVEILTANTKELKERLAYYENVLYTLIVALKEGGVIVDSEDGNYSF